MLSQELSYLSSDIVYFFPKNHWYDGKMAVLEDVYWDVVTFSSMF